MKKAAFIDLDGTALDSERIYQRFWKEAIEECGFESFYCDTLRLRSLDRALADDYLRSVYGPGLDLNKLRQTRNELMDEYLSENRYEVKPGVIQGLGYLRSKGISPYIVSATPREKIGKLLSSYFLKDYFDGIVSAKDAPRGKPFPDCYLLALKEAKVGPEEAIAIEDAPNGIEAALDAGIDTYMAVDLSEPDESLLPRLKGVLHNFAEIRFLL